MYSVWNCQGWCKTLKKKLPNLNKPHQIDFYTASMPYTTFASKASEVHNSTLYHIIIRKTSTAGHRLPPGFAKQTTSATIRSSSWSSILLATDTRFPVRGLHSRTFGPHRQSALHCHLSQANSRLTIKRFKIFSIRNIHNENIKQKLQFKRQFKH